MKKLFFAVILSIGFFTVSQAQVLFYTVDNQSSYAWDFKIGDTAGNGMYHPPFFGVVNGSFNNFSGVVEFGGSNSIGCNAYQSPITAPSAGPVPFPCWVPNVMNYNFIQFGVFFILNVEIS